MLTQSYNVTIIHLHFACELKSYSFSTREITVQKTKVYVVHAVFYINSKKNSKKEGKKKSVTWRKTSLFC